MEQVCTKNRKNCATRYYQEHVTAYYTVHIAFGLGVGSHCVLDEPGVNKRQSMEDEWLRPSRDLAANAPVSVSIVTGEEVVKQSKARARQKEADRVDELSLADTMTFKRTPIRPFIC